MHLKQISALSHTVIIGVLPLYNGGEESATEIEFGLSDRSWKLAYKWKHVRVQGGGQAPPTVSQQGPKLGQHSLLSIYLSPTVLQNIERNDVG